MDYKSLFCIALILSALFLIVGCSENENHSSLENENLSDIVRGTFPKPVFDQLKIKEGSGVGFQCINITGQKGKPNAAPQHGDIMVDGQICKTGNGTVGGMILYTYVRDFRNYSQDPARKKSILGEFLRLDDLTYEYATPRDSADYYYFEAMKKCVVVSDYPAITCTPEAYDAGVASDIWDPARCKGTVTFVSTIGYADGQDLLCSNLRLPRFEMAG